MLGVYAFAAFGYVTAALASFFIGRDADGDNAKHAGIKHIAVNDNDKSSHTMIFTSDSVTIVIGCSNGSSDKLKYHHSMEVLSHEHYIT